MTWHDDHAGRAWRLAVIFNAQGGDLETAENGLAAAERFFRAKISEAHLEDRHRRP